MQELMVYVKNMSLYFVIGERNIFCLTETGNLRYMKKLEYDPSCFLPYASCRLLFQTLCKNIKANFPCAFVLKHGTHK